MGTLQFDSLKNESNCNVPNDSPEIRHSDAWAKEEMTRCLGITSGTSLQKYSKIDRDAALIKLKKSGLSVRQISRLTGIGRNIVQKAGKIY